MAEPISQLENQELWSLYLTLFPQEVQNSSKLADSFDDLISLYSEPHRFYHNVSHLEFLAAEFAKHEDKFGQDRSAVLAALFFHDAIYECKPGHDEQKSADYMVAVLNDLGMGAAVIERAKKIVLATADHEAQGDYAAQLFLDMDMSILAAPPEVYDQYVEGVTKEFCTKLSLARPVFEQARVEKFIEPTLAKGAIFSTDDYKGLEEKAFDNMRREADAVAIGSNAAYRAGKPELKK